MSKKVKYLVSVFVIAFLALSSVEAQNNFGYINTDLIITEMDETKAVGQELRKIGEAYDEEFKELYSDYDTKRKKYESESTIKSEAINRSRAQELASMEERMQKFRQEASQDLSNKQNELMKPVIAKMNKAIEQVAKENGIDFVFDTAQRNMAYSNEKFNLLEKVKKKLGIK